MKNLLILVILTLSFNCFSQTQASLNQEAQADLKNADKKLKNVYQAILTQYKSDKKFTKNIKTSQRLWIKFRDAELAMKYPTYAKGTYGSIQPMCKANYLTMLSQKRIETLQQWLDGVEEGDVCAGSLKRKED